MKRFLRVWLVFLAVSGAVAQENEGSVGHYKPLRLESADEIENQRVDGRDVMWGRGHVRFSQDTLTASGDQAAFFRDLQMAILVGHVVLDDRHRIIFSEKARYYARNKKAVCEGRALFIDRDLTLAADSLVYFLAVEQLVAVGRVVMFDSSEGLTLYGDEGFYDVRKKYARVTGHPRIVQYDSAVFKGENTARRSRGYETAAVMDSNGRPLTYDPEDQLTITGRMVEAYTDSHKVYVRDSVRFVRERLVTESGLADFHTKKEILRLDEKPLATYGSSVLIGEIMHVQFHKREIEKIWVNGNAVATSDADSAGQKTNRLRGKEISMFIHDRTLQRMEANGNAYNLYYLEGQEGVNEISGPRMILFFSEEGKLKRFRVEGGTEGTYYPERLSSRAGGHP